MKELGWPWDRFTLSRLIFLCQLLFLRTPYSHSAAMNGTCVAFHIDNIAE